jgi:TP901 family phage tail tape measure protein
MGIGTSSIEAGKAYVRLYTESSEYVKGLRSAEAKLNAFGNSVASIGAKMTAFATAAGLPIALSARTFANFQDQMLAVKAAANATGDEFDRLYEQAKKLGSTTSFTAAEVGAGQLGLAKAGFTPAEIEAAIPAILSLARATGTELAMATEIAAGSLRAFNLAAIEMPRVVDVLTAAANASDAGIEDLGEAMKYAAPVAYQYGLSLEQTAKSLGVLANLQIKGTMAGTSLRQIMLQLADPKIQKQLAGLGIEAVDAAGNMRPLGDVMVQIGKAMATMGSAERLSLGKDLFDQRAVSAGLVLATQDFDELSDAIENAQGLANRTAKTMDSGLGGAFRILMSAIEGVQIAIGENLTGMLTTWAEQLGASASAVIEWVAKHQGIVMLATKLIAALAIIGGAFIALAVPIKIAAASAGVVSLAFSAITAPAAAATAAVGGLSAAMTFLAAHPVTVVLTALAAVAAALYVTEGRYQSMSSVMGNVREKADDMRAADQALLKELQGLSAKQQMTTEEFTRADEIVDRLEGRYGDLGLTVDRTTGLIDGMAGAQDRLNKAMTGAAIAQLTAEAADLQIQIGEMEKERGGMIRQISEGLFGTGYDKVILDKIMVTSAKRQALLQRIAALQGGSATALVGDKATPTPGDLGGVLPSGDTSDEAAKMNEKILEEISKNRIAMLKDEQDRAIAEINRRYDAERKKAEELGASLSLVEEARKGALAAADAEGQRKKDEEKERKDKEKAKTAKSLADEIKRMEIENRWGAQLPGDLANEKFRNQQKERALLEQERKNRLRDAKAAGEDPEQINKLFDMRFAALDMQDRAQAFQDITPVASTTSAEQAYRLGLGQKKDTASEKTAKATEKTAEGIGFLVKETRQVRKAIMSGGRMTG